MAMFIHANAYRIDLTAKMHPACTHCGEDFIREPGFYFGAAYVSYALTVALWLAVLVALMSFDAWGLIEFGIFTILEHSSSLEISILIALLPLIYRLSRSIWLAMFTKNDA